MPTRFLSDAELARLTGWPDTIPGEELAAVFTLTRDDLDWLVDEHRGAGNRLGLAVQRCTLPWLGWVPDDLTRCPAPAVARLAGALGIGAGEASGLLAGYGGWQGDTRRTHLREVCERLGWTACGPAEWKQLDALLAERALEHDAPTVLFAQAVDWLRGERIVRPGVEPLVRAVAAAREAAAAETAQRLAALLDGDRTAALDGLLTVDADLGLTRLGWLRSGATAATAEVFKTELAKLAFLRSAGVDNLDLSVLPVGRRRHLAEIGRRAATSALARTPPARRHPVLLATLAETHVEVLDELVTMLDVALATADGRARAQLVDVLAERGRAEVDRGRLLDEVLAILADPDIPDADAGRLVRARIGMDRLRSAVRPQGQRPQRDHGHLELLAARYRHLRAFTPAVLAALPLAGSDAATPLLTAVEVLRGLNAAGKLRVPDDVPTSFVPTRWRGYLEHSRGDGYGAAHRHYWELGVLYALQAALRSGDVWVPGSRRFTDPAHMLLPAERFTPRRLEFCAVTGTDPDPHRQIDRLDRRLHGALAALEDTLAGSDGPAHLDENGRLVVTPLAAEQLPDGTADLAAAAAALLPRVDLAGLLIEVDSWTGFTAELTHAAGAGHGRRGPQDPDLRRNLYATLLAHGCNLGIAGMADASGISEDALAWTSTWHLRGDTLTAANTRLVDAHHRLPLAQAWGGGTLSSSDGQRFPQRGKSLTARALSRYFLDEGTTTYTHVADQHTTYGTKVIPSTVRDAVHVLDAILGNPTDLPIAEHTTDTHGQTLAVFGLFDLLGLTFSPHIRDLADLTLHRLGPSPELVGRYPHAGPLLTAPIRTGLIADAWDDLLRLAASMKFGHATASLLIARLHAGARQHSLAKALHEYGRLVRTVFVLRYLTDTQLRRRVRRQLNKGENLHALRRRLFFAYQGHVRRRRLDDQVDQALCLTLVTNAVVLWNTVYLTDALDHLRDTGRPVHPDAVAHLSPAQDHHLNPYGRYAFDLDTELAPGRRRPLRVPGASA